jgi:F-box and leucine-rich repeat protein GRR1
MALASSAPNLQGVDLSGLNQVTDMGILELSTKSLRLEWMHLNGVTGLTDPALSAVVKSCPHLTELELCNLPLLTAISVRDLWSYSRELRTLRLAHCASLTDKAFPAPIDATAQQTGSEKPLPPIPTTVTTLPPLTLSHMAENLKVLDLSNCSQLTDVAIEGIVKHAPKIQTLILSGCSQLTSRAVASICSLGDHLDTLNVAHVANISDRAIVNLARSCSKLRCLDLACAFNRRFFHSSRRVTRGC